MNRPINQADIENLRREEFEAVGAQDKPSGSAQVWDVANLLALPAPPIDWLIGDIWPMGVHSDLFAPPECGKSTIAWSQIIAIATGRSWFGKMVKQGRVLVVGGEFTNDIWAARSISRFLGNQPFPKELVKITPTRPLL